METPVKMIERVEAQQWNEVMRVWESAVRATHHFLREEDLQFYKKMIPEHYLSELSLYCIRDATGEMLGFLGASDEEVEMLFIRSEARGGGVGRQLLDYAVHTLGLRRVGVNEQNGQALGFYLHMGFRVAGRMETDAEGKPYPVLAMKWENENFQ